MIAVRWALLFCELLLLLLLLFGAEGRNEELKKEDLIRKPRALAITQTVTTPERALSEGYPSETHKITTADGYILEVHRIPYGRFNENVSNNSLPNDRPPILLMHCVLCSSIDWLLNYPDKALGFILADHGYDVWMANARGNFYSKKHVSFSTKQKEFWDFSFHEIALYDMPATIDHILEVTGNTQISYMGYSMGSVLLYALLSEKQEYNQKIRVAAVLGPAAYLTHSQGSLFMFSSQVTLIEKLANIFGIWEMRPQNPLMNLAASTLCNNRNIQFRHLCISLFSFNIEINEDISSMDFLPFILSHILSGGSLKTVTHLMQVKNSGRFQKYDYGTTKNLELYGQSRPPVYHINRTTIPIGLFSSRGDKYVRPEDVDRLAEELPNVVLKHEVPNPKFSHFDFLWAKDNTKTLYRRILALLDQFL